MTTPTAQLYCTYNHFGNEGAAAFSRALAASRTICSVILMDVVVALLGATDDNRSAWPTLCLEQLFLVCIHIDDRCAAELASALVVNSIPADVRFTHRIFEAYGQALLLSNAECALSQLA